MNSATLHFIETHLNDDVRLLALQAARHKDVDMPFAISQIAGKQKMKHKVPSFYEVKELLYPQQLSLEQSSSESTAKYKSLLCEGNILIDLTGGFGIDCFFMSSNFKTTIYVERNKELCDIATHNFGLFSDKNIKVIHNDSVSFIANIGMVADCIFIDPARRSESGSKVFRISDCEPDVEQLQDILLQKSEKAIIKLSPMLDIDLALKSLPFTKQVHIISVENECKELLFMLEKNYSGDVEIIAANIKKDNTIEQFQFNQVTENNSENSYSLPIKYLFEPNASILKSGAFKAIGAFHQLYKLHKNTHLYTSTNCIENFQGRI